MVNARKYGIDNASAIWYPPIALGLSTKTSVPWHASHDVFNKSSSHPRNYHSILIMLVYELMYRGLGPDLVHGFLEK